MSSPIIDDSIADFRGAKNRVARIQLRVVADGNAVSGFRRNRAIREFNMGLPCAIKSGKRGIEILFDLEIGESDMARLDVDHVRLILI